MYPKNYQTTFLQAASRDKPAVPKTFSQLTEVYLKDDSGFINKDETKLYICPNAISPNILTSRFKITEEGGFIFYHHPIHKKLHTAFAKIVSRPGKYYYEGPQGIGKSFALLSLVALLRQGSDKFRVIYINNPGQWKANPTDYIINEMLWAFMMDQNSFPPCSGVIQGNQESLEQWYSFLQNSNNKERDYEDFLKQASYYCHQKNLLLILLMDQENSIGDMQNTSTLEFTYKFPFSFYQNMPFVDFVLTFSSANNKTNIKRTEEWEDFAKIFDAPVKEFDFISEIAVNLILDQLSAFGKLGEKLSNNIVEKCAKIIIHATKANSQELMLFLESCVSSEGNEKDMVKKIKVYLEKRFSELLKAHEKFIQTHIKADLKNYALAVSYLDTDFQLPGRLFDSYDKKLAYLQDNKLTSLFPLAKKVFYTNLSNNNDIVENLVSDYLQLKITGQGNILQFYILHSIKKRSNNFRSLRLSYKHIKTKITGTKSFDIQAYEDLWGIPIQKPTQTTLYVPVSNTYPDIDCLIYDSSEDQLYPIQITLTQKNYKDSYHSWSKTKEKEWLKVFQGSQVTFIWLVGHPKKYTRMDQNYWVVTFESLPETNQNDFLQFVSERTRLQEMLEMIDKSVIETDENGNGEPEDESDEF